MRVNKYAFFGLVILNVILWFTTGFYYERAKRCDRNLVFLKQQVGELQARVNPDPETFSLETQEFLSARQITAATNHGLPDNLWAFYFRDKTTRACSLLYVHDSGGSNTYPSPHLMARGHLTPRHPQVNQILPKVPIFISFDFGDGLQLANAPPPMVVRCPATN